MDKWESRLDAARQAGYNMVHLTPLQHLGNSRSSYCIQDQLKLNPAFQATLPQLHDLLSKLHKEWGLLTITDVVLNHSANESPWLQEHPECAYNLSNSPHLRPAYLLDRAIFLLSLDLIEGRWLSHGASANICGEEGLGRIHNILHSEYLAHIKIPEFYKVDVEALVLQFSQKIKGELLLDITLAQAQVWYGRYFHRPGPDLTLEEEETRMGGPQSCLIMAHNGWVMGDDPLRDFAKPGSNVYIRRELIAWGDSVKLRYGDGPQDCPFLYEHMGAYVEQMATICHGLRLDNCHSTPIHAAEYLIDRARKIRPDLYVIAELFTSSDTVDNIFVNRLGINSLIREGMAAPNSHELGRLVYRFGGEPVGDFFQPIQRPLTPSIAHAIFIDQTHDNPSPIQKRSVFDLLPSAALISMACCATGSTRGYDELVPHAVSQPAILQLPEVRVEPGAGAGVVEEVVLEARLRPRPISGSNKQNTPWTQNASYINGLQSEYTLELREHLRLLDSQMVEMNTLNEVEFHSFPPGSVVAFRVSMSGDSRAAVHRLRGCIAQFGYRLQRSNSLGGAVQQADFQTLIRPLSLATLNYVLFRCAEEEKEEPGGGPYHIPGWEDLLYCGFQGTLSTVELCATGVMTPLSTIHMKHDLGHPLCENLRQGDWLPQYLVSRLERHPATKDLAGWFNTAFSHLRQLPRYLVPAYFDSLVTGAYSALLSAAWSQMSPLVSQGSTFIRMLALGSVALIGHVPSSPLPDVGGSTHETATLSAGANIWLSFPFYLISNGRLNNLRGCLQACPTLQWAMPETGVETPSSQSEGCTSSLADLKRQGGWGYYGLIQEHFNLPSNQVLCRNTILAFGGCLRHGLIPNLLDRGSNARYNCRDAVWWWLQAIQDYCAMTPDGLNILTRSVARLYLTDDAESGAHVQPLHDIMQEALQRHYLGIHFRERNAGPRIDSQMTDPGNESPPWWTPCDSSVHHVAGFNVEAHIDQATGFVVGGNVHNCGTWMDKMGSAPDNRGKPATPRLCADAFRMLTVAYGEATLDRSNVYRWYKVLSEGREDVNDEERAGRPSTSTTDEKINEVEKMILANRQITVREVAEDLNISIGSCRSIFINDLGMRQVAAIPKLLNCDQKQHRMNIANEMLDSVRDDPNLLQRVITGDEAWVYGNDVETKAQSSQWKLPHEPRPKKASQVRSNVKVLLTVFFNCRGVVHHEFLPQGRTVNKEYYLQVMRNLREANRQKHPDLWKNKNWLLHHDNAPAHTSLLVRDFLAKNNTLMMLQPLYSPDLAPCDFFLFPKLKRPMKGRRYATLDEIKTASKEELKKIFKNDFLKCFEDWKNRWHKCIISHGDCFEGDKIGIHE
ncbi:AGL [Cordylochernes scorpioides]|uniref:AGL n=1 Tax=Cordylochernes scorpioides TaxID=51811 RepID=A0ABY6KWF4_9ARAC|nr:AGL [Cordylochernes scorpioides]